MMERRMPGTGPYCNELPLQAMEVHMVQSMMIKDQMEVIGSDGVHVGTVDHMEGSDQVMLSKDDPDAGGEHHFLPLKHDPEKWEPVFGKDHAQTRS